MNSDEGLNKPSGETSGSGLYDVLIIGGGPAGATAAIYTSRAGLKTLVVDRGLTAGSAGKSRKVANYPGALGEISGTEIVTLIRTQAQGFGAEFVTDKIIGVDFQSDEKTLFGNNNAYTARAVIIATGALGRGTTIKGEEELLGQGLSYCATCDGAFYQDQEVALAGNTDEAIEEALFLTNFVTRVHFLSPTPDLKAPEHLIDELVNNPKVTLYKNVSLREIVGGDQVEGVRFTQRGKPEQTLAVSGAFLYLQGSKPITDFLADQLETSKDGYLIVDQEFQTNLPGVYAAGDVVFGHIKQAVIAAAHGAAAGIAAEKFLRGRKKMVADWETR